MPGITDYQDLTDRHHGLRLVMTVKSGYDPEAVLQQLYRYTPLEENFGINNVALVDGQPRTLGLKQLLEVFVDHRLKVVRRRADARLSKRPACTWWRVYSCWRSWISTRSSRSCRGDQRDGARSADQRGVRPLIFQAEYILEVQLRRLTKFSQIDLEAETDDLRREIEELEEILGSDAGWAACAASPDELAAVAATRRFPPHRAGGSGQARREGGGLARGGRRALQRAAHGDRADHPDHG